MKKNVHLLAGILALLPGLCMATAIPNTAQRATSLAAALAPAVVNTYKCRCITKDGSGWKIQAQDNSVCLEEGDCISLGPRTLPATRASLIALCPGDNYDYFFPGDETGHPCDGYASPKCQDNPPDTFLPVTGTWSCKQL